MHVRPRLTTLCAALLLVAAAPVFAAQSQAPYPNKPIRIIAASSAGSGPDIMARLLGQKLIDAWGQQVVVDVRTGASGMIGAEVAARANPDGYTFLIVTSQHAIINNMYAKRSYDLVRDFAPVSLMASTPFIMLVHPSVAAGSVKEFIALAKAKPGQLKYGSGGSGSPPHLSAEILRSMTGMDLLHVLDVIEAAGDSRLVRDDGDWHTGAVECGDRLGGAVDQVDAIDRTDVAVIDDHRSVPVQEHPSPTHAAIPRA